MDSTISQIYLIYNKIIMVQSSMSVFFFKQGSTVSIEQENVTQWKQYSEIEDGGFIHFSRGNKQIQITTDKQIKFYEIDEVTHEIRLKHVLYNFIGCNSMMFSSQNKHCITYKQG